MAKNNQWLDWLKCNILELVILILVLVLLVKVFSAPVVEEAPSAEEINMEEPLAEESDPEVLVEEIPAEAEEQPLEEEATPEPVVEETPAE